MLPQSIDAKALGTGATSGLDRDQLERLGQDGALRLRGCISSDWIEVLKQGIDRNIDRPGPFFRELSQPGQPGRFRIDMWTRDRIPEFSNFIANSGIASLAAAALGEPQVRLLQDTWFAKSAGTSERTPWHHDTVILGPFLSIWIALDSIPRASSLEFVRGSHLWKRFFMPKTYFETTDDDKLLETEKYYLDYHKGELRQNNPAENASLFEPLPDIEKNKAQFEIISWDMEAGDCILFHALTLHGAPGNCGDAPMRRFVTRWVNSKAVLSPHGETTKSMLLAHGFHVPFSAGEPVRGELFPLLPIERDRPKLAVEQF